MRSSSNAKSGRRKQPSKVGAAPSNSDHRTGPLRSNKNAGLVVGVDIGGSNLRVALADINGSLLAKWSTSTATTSSPDAVIAQIEQGIEVLLKQRSSSRRMLLSVAAGVPGITDPKSGIVVATSYLRGWRNVPFQALLESAFGVPASIENDVRMAALGEHWTGAARGVDDFVFLAIGTGIAAGVFANGRLVHGSNCTAGEVGYMYVPGSCEKPAEPGAPGSLEQMIAGDGIREQWLKASRGKGRSKELNATQVFALASTGDVHARAVLDRSAQLLAYAVYNISLVLNSSLFVFGGGIGVSIPLRDATEHILSQYSEPSTPRLIISKLGTDAQLMGAIRLALTTADHVTA